MKVLVLGATGLTGREVLDRTLEYGHEPAALVRDPAKLDPRHGTRVEVFEGDVTDFSTVMPTSALRLGSFVSVRPSSRDSSRSLSAGRWVCSVASPLLRFFWSSFR